MVRMTCGSTRIGKRTYTPADGLFEAAPEVEQRLVARGVAEYAGQPASAVVASGSTDESGDSACVDMPGEENGAAGNAEANLDTEQLQEMTVAQLSALAADLDIDTAKLRKKDDFIAAISAVSVQPDEEAAEEDLPELSAAAPVV